MIFRPIFQVGCARASAAVTDENGSYGDWVEIWNSADHEMNLHGIGLSNLKRVIESYQGVLQIDDQGGVFQVEWMIPVPVAG